MRFDTPSVCASCIEDAQSGSSNFLGSGAPIWWYIDGIRSCPIHGRALIQLPRPERGRCKHDHAGRVRDNISLITRALKIADICEPSELECYVIRRLSCGRSKHHRWVDRLDIGTVIRASEQLGLAALGQTGRDQNEIDKQTLTAASSLGFSAISRGPRNLARQLTRLRPKRPRGGFYSEFFPFSRWPERMQSRPGCAPLCDVAREFVVHNYPCDVGEVVFGKRVSTRHVHSISSAAEKAKVPFPRMRKALGAAREGQALSHLPRPDRNLWVKTADWDEWLERFGSAMTLKPAARRLGVCSSTFSRLVSDGFFKPLASVPEMAPRYLPSDIDKLVAAVCEKAVTVQDISKGMLVIGAVQSSLKTSLSTVLQLLLDQRLKTVSKLESRCGISGVCVAREEVLDLLEGPPLPGLGSIELRKYLRINCLTTPWLVSNGFLKSELALHPRTRKSVQLFRYNEIDKFLAEYETVGRLSHRLTTKPPYVVKQLKQKGLEPLDVERNMSVIYRRRDLPEEFL